VPFESLDERMSYELPVYYRHQSQFCLFGAVHLIAKIERIGKSVYVGYFASSNGGKQIERIVDEIQRHWRSGRERSTA
jgi:hypothetical protein